MGPQSVREYAASLHGRYRAASRTEKTRLLDEFCQAAGRHRKPAIRRLGQPRRAPRGRGGRPPRYGPAVVELLARVWQASDYLCGKRLAQFLAPLLEALERHHELEVPPALRPLLLGISPATIDRLLRSKRRAHPRGMATTGPSHPALASQVPVRTFADWQGVRPGALQADLVAHCGESTAGFFLTSLVAVDVATGGTECGAVWGKGYHHGKEARRRIPSHMPMPGDAFPHDNRVAFFHHS